MATATVLEAPTQAPALPTPNAGPSLIEEPLYEVVNGRRVELPPMAASSNRVAGILGLFMDNWVRGENLGRVSIEMLHWLDREEELERRPDVSFVSYSRWPREKPIPDDEAWDAIPELAVEVVSPTDRADALLEKIEDYFDGGVHRVWVVYPRRRVVHVFESFTRITVVADGLELDGGSILPGFRLPLSVLFEELGAREGKVNETTS
jgi:Uma2 family endonuclease